MTIPVYSEQNLTPRAAEVLREIANTTYPELDIKFRLRTLNDKKVLVFGNGPTRVGGIDGVEFVYTYSIAQMMSRPNAMSVVGAGLRNFLNVAEPIPFEEISAATFSTSVHRHGFDFDQPIAIDIETSGGLGQEHTPEEVGLLSVALYQPGRAPLVIMTGIVNIIDGKHVHNDLGQGMLQFLAKWLPKFKYPIYHNGKFDTRVLNRILGVRLPVWFDTMLAHHTLNHASTGSHGLKLLAQRYFNAPEWEAGLKKYTLRGGHYEYIPPKLLREYNGWDVYWTYKLYELFAPQIASSEDYQKCFNFELAAADFLLQVEEYGIPFDMDYATTYSSELQYEAETMLQLLRNLLNNDEFNPNSPKQVKEAFLGWGVELVKTDEATLTELQNDKREPAIAKEFARVLLEYRKLVKMNGTYALGWMKRSRKGRVHPTFLVHGTSTGRLSSTDPNAQNVPREKAVRKLVRVHE